MKNTEQRKRESPHPCNYFAIKIQRFNTI